jgi:ribosomal protein S28E/S33
MSSRTSSKVESRSVCGCVGVGEVVAMVVESCRESLRIELEAAELALTWLGGGCDRFD